VNEFADSVSREQANAQLHHAEWTSTAV